MEIVCEKGAHFPKWYRPLVDTLNRYGDIRPSFVQDNQSYKNFVYRLSPRKIESRFLGNDIDGTVLSSTGINPESPSKQPLRVGTLRGKVTREGLRAERRKSIASGMDSAESRKEHAKDFDLNSSLLNEAVGYHKGVESTLNLNEFSKPKQAQQ